MRARLSLLALLLLASAPAVAEPSAAPNAAPGAALGIDRHAAAIVSVEMVLHIKRSSRDGQTREREQRMTTTGLVVDASGLVMLGGAGQLANRSGGSGGRGSEVTPGEIKVRFPGEEKEYRAGLAATDAELGLAFVQIEDLGDRKPVVLDFAAAIEPQIGQLVTLLGRRSRGYDDAPFISQQRVNGEIAKPRRAWTTDGFGKLPGQPVFTTEGTPVGVIARIAPVRDAVEVGGRWGGRGGFGLGGGGAGGGGSFILPAAIVSQRIVAALAEVKRLAAERAAESSQEKKAPETPEKGN